jgi:hypothetical protein
MKRVYQAENEKLRFTLAEQGEHIQFLIDENSKLSTLHQVPQLLIGILQ